MQRRPDRRNYFWLLKKVLNNQKVASILETKKNASGRDSMFRFIDFQEQHGLYVLRQIECMCFGEQGTHAADNMWPPKWIRKQ